MPLTTPPPRLTSRLPSRLRRLAAAAAVAGAAAAAALLLSAAPAAAHADLVGSTPSNGSVVAHEPRQIVLAFSEAVTLALSSVKVIGPDGRRLDQPLQYGPSGRDSLAAALAPDASQGTYALSWQATAADDGHTTSGFVTFSVGAPSALPASAGTGARDGLTDAVLDIAEWLGFAGLALAAGYGAIRWYCLPSPRPNPQPSPAPEPASDEQSIPIADPDSEPNPDPNPDPGPASRPRSPAVRDGALLPRWPAVLGWSLLLLGTVAQLFAFGLSARGESLAHLFDRSLLSVTLSTRLGHALEARIALLAVLAALGEVLLRRAVGAVAGLLLVLALAATWSATSHAASGSDVLLALAVTTVHVVSMALWTGGLFTLTVLLFRRARSVELPGVAARFSRLALACVALLIASGIYQAWREIGGISGLTDSTYGVLLLVKIGVVAAVVAVASRSRRLVHRRLGAGLAALRTSVLVELVGVTAVLVITILLLGNAPPR